MVVDIIYDIETYPNVFTLSAESADAPFRWSFEISDYRNDSVDLMNWLWWIKDNNHRMCGFNNIGFDYPVVHLLTQMGKADAKSLYDKAQAVIGSQDTNRWQHLVYPSDRFCEQIDLYLIHHFDNFARATSLKVLEFNMHLDNVSDLPYPIGSILNREQIVKLKEYNAHDVSATKRFYHESLEMIKFREELTIKYSRSFMDHNDTKIGKDYFIMELEASGVQCYRYGKDGRTPMQTLRPVIALKDAILPWIAFQQPEFTRILNWMKSQTITETKGVFKDVSCTINNFTFVFGLGGIHGSVDSETVVADDDYCICSVDVASYYPNLAIVNRFRPEHLGDKFCDIYKNLYEMRKTFKKGTAGNAMLKLALNGTYGDSNNKFSVFYDPLFTMSITLNGELLLCLLAEKLMEVPSLKLLMLNTDGLECRVLRSDVDKLRSVCKWWENITKLQLEEARYSKLIVADVNSYLAVYEDGKVKRKGRYEYDLEWHQNASSLVIPKVAEKVLLEGVPIRETLENWSDKMDFMLRVKVPRTSQLLLVENGVDKVIQNITRYYVSVGGGQLVKLMPPLAKKPDVWRRIGVESGWTVCECNNIHDAVLPINYDYYINEVEKLVMGVM